VVLPLRTVGPGLFTEHHSVDFQTFLRQVGIFVGSFVFDPVVQAFIVHLLSTAMLGYKLHADKTPPVELNSN